MIQQIGLIILGGLGFLISLYFTLVYYRILRPDFWMIPKACQMDERSCRSILSTKEGKLFGLPNAVLGLLYYGVIVWAAADTDAVIDRPTLARLLIVSLATVAVSVYLSYALLFKLRTNCSLCFVSNLVNAVIFILLIEASRS